MAVFICVGNLDFCFISVTALLRSGPKMLTEVSREAIGTWCFDIRHEIEGS